MAENISDVIVIGGGAAGLAASTELARHGLSVTLVEARERLGGRILTRRPRGWGRPIELGAEFVHEGNPFFWNLARRHQLTTKQMAGRHWLFAGGKLERIDDVAERIHRVTKKIDPRRIGRASFASFLKQNGSYLPDEAVQLAQDFIEGFEAAPSGRMSARAVAGATLNDAKQFLVPRGYDRLIDAMAEALPRERVRIFLRTAVTRIEWRRGATVVVSGRRKFVAARCVVTVPLGVLQARPRQPGALHFVPPLGPKQRLLAKMGMGSVVRVVIRFRKKAWRAICPKALGRGSRPDFGFLHSRVSGFPVWWAHYADGILTGWAGGPAATRLEHCAKRQLRGRALSSLSEILGVPQRVLASAVSGFEIHNWVRDRFSRGAYSYVTAGLDEAAQRLREPLKGTLFFAGEATADAEEIGTVHGALGSGRRVAREIVAARKTDPQKSRRRRRP